MKSLIFENNKERFSFNEGDTLSVKWFELDEFKRKVWYDELIYTHEEETPLKVNCVKLWRVKDEKDCKNGLLVYLGEKE